MAWLEPTAAVLLIANGLLLARRSLLNFPVGIAGVVLYAVVFYRARLYSDVLLQGFYVVVQAWGWRSWSRVQHVEGEVVVTRMPRGEQVGYAAAIGLATAGWGALMHRYTDAAAPWLDAGIAMTSVVAQILMTRRRLESWYLWCGVNVLSVALYASRGLWITAVLYVGMLAVSLVSLRLWQQASQRAPAS